MPHDKHDKTAGDRRAEPGAEAAQPSPGESSDNARQQADRMYREAARDLADKGASDPKKAGELVNSRER